MERLVFPTKPSNGSDELIGAFASLRLNNVIGSVRKQYQSGESRSERQDGVLPNITPSGGIDVWAVAEQKRREINRSQDGKKQRQGKTETGNGSDGGGTKTKDGRRRTEI